jgi:antitoxin VapB
MVRTAVIRDDSVQMIKLPKNVALPDGVREVVILRDGPRRIIVPADSQWDDFFDAPGVDLGDRDQPKPPIREPF